MPLQSLNTYNATLFTPPSPTPYDDRDIDRVLLPGTIALRVSGSNELVGTITSQQAVAFKAALDALDSSAGYRGLPVHFLLAQQRYTLWTNAITFNTANTEYVIDLNQIIDTTATDLAVSGGYIVTSPERADSDHQSQSALPSSDRPVTPGTPDEEDIIVRVTNEEIQREGTLYTVEFAAFNRVTVTSRIRITADGEMLDFGVVYADDATPGTPTTWRAQIADDNYLASIPRVAAQAPVNPPAVSFNGFTRVQLVGNGLVFTRPDGTTATVPLPTASADSVVSLTPEAGGVIAYTTRGGTVNRITVSSSESTDDFVDITQSAASLTFVRRSGTSPLTVTIPLRTNAEIDTRADMRIRDASNRASTAQVGVVELASSAEGVTGLDTERAMTAAATRAHGDNRYALITHTHTPAQVVGLDALLLAKQDNIATARLIPSTLGDAGQVLAVNAGRTGTEFIDIPTGTGGGVLIPSATMTERGIVELASIGEATAGTDDERVITPAVLTAWETSQGARGGTPRLNELRDAANIASNGIVAFPTGETLRDIVPTGAIIFHFSSGSDVPTSNTSLTALRIRPLTIENAGGFERLRVTWTESTQTLQMSGSFVNRVTQVQWTVYTPLGLITAGIFPAHTHTINEVINLQTELNGKQPVLTGGTMGQLLARTTGDGTEWTDPPAAATMSVAGLVEIATLAESRTGTATAVVPSVAGTRAAIDARVPQTRILPSTIGSIGQILTVGPSGSTVEWATPPAAYTLPDATTSDTGGVRIAADLNDLGALDVTLASQVKEGLALKADTTSLPTAIQLVPTLGTAGQVLTVNTGATAAEWVTPMAGGTTFAAADYVKVNPTRADGATDGAAAASGILSVAVGSEATASGSVSLALGRQSSAAGTNSIAIGPESLSGGSSATDTIAIGTGAIASRTHDIAFGTNSRQNGSSSRGFYISATAVSAADRTTGGRFDVADVSEGFILIDPTHIWQKRSGVYAEVGTGFAAADYVKVNPNHGDGRSDGAATASGVLSTAIGPEASATGSSTVAIGRQTQAAANNSTAIGSSAQITEDGGLSTAIGYESRASALSATAIGYLCRVAGQGAVAVGANARAPNQDDVAIGDNSGNGNSTNQGAGIYISATAISDADRTTDGTTPGRFDVAGVIEGFILIDPSHIWQKRSGAYVEIGAGGGTTIADARLVPTPLGTAGQILAVNEAADGTEFVDAPSGGGGGGTSSVNERVVILDTLTAHAGGWQDIALPSGDSVTDYEMFEFVVNTNASLRGGVHPGTKLITRAAIEKGGETNGVAIDSYAENSAWRVRINGGNLQMGVTSYSNRQIEGIPFPSALSGYSIEQVAGYKTITVGSSSGGGGLTATEIITSTQVYSGGNQVIPFPSGMSPSDFTFFEAVFTRTAANHIGTHLISFSYQALLAARTAGEPILSPTLAIGSGGSLITGAFQLTSSGDVTFGIATQSGVTVTISSGAFFWDLAQFRGFS